MRVSREEKDVHLLEGDMVNIVLECTLDLTS